MKPLKEQTYITHIIKEFKNKILSTILLLYTLFNMNKPSDTDKRIFYKSNEDVKDKIIIGID